MRPLLAALMISTAFSLELPNVLGEPPAKDKEEWVTKQRPATFGLFEEHVYGRVPAAAAAFDGLESPRSTKLDFEVVETDSEAMGGAATLKIVKITFGGRGGEQSMKVSLFVPNEAKKPVPAFLLICNRGYENIDPTRKQKDDFWPAEEIVARGYVAAAFHNSEVAPDEKNNRDKGVHGLFGEETDDSWGTIAAWGWGASRVMDYFETDPDVDAERVALVGHSRGGKASLWAGARDQRFALVVSNNSGCSGAALARRKHGERVERINTAFPHWFCENYNRYNGKEEEMPVDQHQLIALMAPRPVYVASASEDDWADPEGEFLAAVHAAPVYELFGLKGIGTDQFPKANTPLQDGHVGYHLREGEHDLTLYDWERYMDFADKRMVARD